MVKKRIFFFFKFLEVKKSIVQYFRGWIKEKGSPWNTFIEFESLEDDSLNRNKSLEGEWYKYDGDLLLVSLFRGFLTWKKSNICAWGRPRKRSTWRRTEACQNHLSQPRNESPMIPTPCQPFDETPWLQVHDRLWARGTQLSCSPVPHLNKWWYNKYFIFL